MKFSMSTVLLEGMPFNSLASVVLVRLLVISKMFLIVVFSVNNIAVKLCEAWTMACDMHAHTGTCACVWMNSIERR
jgi:hypothetical protein